MKQTLQASALRQPGLHKGTIIKALIIHLDFLKFLPPKAIHNLKPYLHLPLLCVLLTACGGTKDKGITIAAAANMQNAIGDLIKAFEAKTGKGAQLIISSSGKLTAQIKEGAPYDLFVSADLKYPQAIHAAGLAREKPRTYAYGKLVLWTRTKGLEANLAALEEVRHIALANPKTAPYGRAAMEVLEHYGLYERLKDKLVFGESVSQVNQFITSGAAQIGFTANAVVQSPGMRGEGQWMLIDPAAYSRIDQGIVLLRSRPEQEELARAFYDFLFSVPGQDILERYGYEVERQAQEQ